MTLALMKQLMRQGYCLDIEARSLIACLGLSMNVLLLGLSRFARRRVLPALATLDEIEAVHVATIRGSDADLAEVPKRGRVFRTYAQALEALAPALVTSPSRNDQHARWAQAALERGHHFIVDKPAFLDLATAERLAALARDRRAVLAEATTWAFHPPSAT